MQQTEKRGFNIIETSDAFSPDALNDNTRKLEAALDAHEEAVAVRLAGLEKFHFAYGNYVGSGSGNPGVTVTRGFVPSIVMVQSSSYGTYLLDAATGWVRFTEDGFRVALNGEGSINNKGRTYFFCALGLDE